MFRREGSGHRLEMPDQMSNAIRIFCNRTIFGMRKLSMKRFHNNTIARDTGMMIGTSHLCFLQRTISSFRAVRLFEFVRTTAFPPPRSFPSPLAGVRESRVSSRKTSVSASLTSPERIRSAPTLPFWLRTHSDSREFILLDDISIKEKSKPCSKREIDTKRNETL